MASKRHLRRKQCERKEPMSKAAAFTYANRLRERLHTAVDAYPCPRCGGWHVGKRPRKVQQRINAARAMRRKYA